MPRFFDNQRGAAVIVFILALIPILLIAGAAVDYSQLNSDREALQNDLDAAVLAGASLKNATPEQRIAAAAQHFNSVLSEKLAAYNKTVTFELKGSAGVKGAANVEVPTQIMSIFGWRHTEAKLIAVADVSERGHAVLDLVFCIDVTGSMGPTIAAVKNNARTMKEKINQALIDNNLQSFGFMRMRVLLFQDFGQATVPYVTGAGAFSMPAMEEAPGSGSFYDLSNAADSASFEAFMAAANAGEGGDANESGLICLNEAIRSRWTKPGDPLPGGASGTVSEEFPLIVLWTDADTHPVEQAIDPHFQSLPAAQNRPMSLDGLKARWQDPAFIDQRNKQLIQFGFIDGPSSTAFGEGCQSNAGNPHCLTWYPLFKDEATRWDNASYDNLFAANNALADRIVQALQGNSRIPRLTQ